MKAYCMKHSFMSLGNSLKSHAHNSHGMYTKQIFQAKLVMQRLNTKLCRMYTCRYILEERRLIYYATQILTLEFKLCPGGSRMFNKLITAQAIAFKNHSSAVCYIELSLRLPKIFISICDMRWCKDPVQCATYEYASLWYCRLLRFLLTMTSFDTRHKCKIYDVFVFAFLFIILDLFNSQFADTALQSSYGVYI